MTEAEKARGLAIAKAALPGAVWEPPTEHGHVFITNVNGKPCYCSTVWLRTGGFDWRFDYDSLVTGTADQLRDRIRRDALAQLALLGG